MAYTAIPSDVQSDELVSVGGFPAVTGGTVQTEDNNYLTKVQMVVLDDNAFAQYCRQSGAEPQTDGGIVINQIWDSTSSNFRYRKFIPLVKEAETAISLKNAKGEMLAEIPVAFYTAEKPVLREQYDDYALVFILPLSLWDKFPVMSGAAEPDTFLRILTADDTQLSEDTNIVREILEKHYKIEIENRVREQETNDRILQGYTLLISAFCILLAIIGIANIFSNTLGFLYQRKREFARYLSVGVTPEGIKKILWIEAFAVAGKPILITLPLTLAFVWFSVTASYLDISEFLTVAPVVPIIIFIAGIFFFVGLAYYIGGRKIFRENLSEMLVDDTR